jgi:hypothetical protein
MTYLKETLKIGNTRDRIKPINSDNYSGEILNKGNYFLMN